LGLVPAIRALAEEASAKAGLALELNLDDAVRCLSSEAEHSLYRVAQEAIANVLKHASASTLSVSLTGEADKTVLSIKDDGAGFKPGNDSESGHFGLVGMRERVEALGGAFHINSSPGAGTEVRVSM
jgi:signal transduction histidine kinase